MALVDDYNTALDTWEATPTGANAVAVVAAWGKLPKSVTIDGETITRPDLPDAVTDMAATEAAASSSAADRRRLIRAGTAFSGFGRRRGG